MKKLALLAVALVFFGCLGFQPSAAQNALQQAPTGPQAPAAVYNATPAAPQTHLVPYEVNETYLEAQLVTQRVLAGPQNAPVKSLSVARVNEVNNSEDDCSASLVVKNPNPFGVWFSGEFNSVMDSAPTYQMHFTVQNTVSQIYAASGGEAILPSATYHPAYYMGPYNCRIDADSASFTVLEQDGVHYAEIENTVYVNRTRTVIMYRNETVA